tara:strand:- start:190 stop:774 length:585 start_codon:yes stop_codon:yes gene_type:complete
MAYPARNFEKDPSKRTKGWYMVPGKGRRYWDGKAFKYRSPDGTTNVKDMVGDRLKGLVKRISKGSEKGRAINERRRSRNRGRGTAVSSEGKSTAPNPESKSGQNNPTTQQKPEVKKQPVTKPKVEKKPAAKKAKQTGDRGKDMAAWAKANKKLAQRFLDKHKNKDKKPKGYASVLKALRDEKANKTAIPKTYNA